MRVRAPLIALAVVACLVVPRPGQASEAAFSEGLATAIFHYQISLAELRYFVEECRPSLMSEAAESDWEKAIAVMRASLNTSGAPEDLAEDSRQTMSMRLTPPDCDDEGRAEDAEWVAERGWSTEIAEALGYLGLNVVAEPLPGERFDEVEALLRQEAGVAARVITCVAATDPLWLPEVYGDWRRAMIEAGTTLVSVGFPPSRMRNLLNEAEAATVPEPEFGEVLASRKAECEADKDWESLFGADDKPVFSERFDAILAGN